MNQIISGKKVTKVIYIGVSLLFLFFLIGNEFFWRYDSKLDMTIRTKLRDAKMSQRNLVIHELSNSPVDTTRREYKDIRHGKTNVAAWLDGGQDTIHLVLAGKYISEARLVHISSDSSTQVILVSNTIQGLSSGSNTILYIKNDSTLSLLECFGFIGDVDKDGNEEINIPEKGGWVRLDPVTANWIHAELKPPRTTP